MGIAKRAEKLNINCQKPGHVNARHHNSSEKSVTYKNWFSFITGSIRISFTLFYLLSLLLFLSHSRNIYAQPQSQTFSSSGNFTVPAGVTQVTIECWGGGGGGGRARGNPATGGGGAGGSYVRSTLNVGPGDSYQVSVGSGGSGGNGTGTTTQHGRDGGDSWFGSASTIIAKGGAGGQSAGNVNNSNGLPGIGSSFGCIGDIVYAGGSGSQGDYTSGSGYSGAGGGGAGSTGPGGNAINGSGGTGTSLNGGNGANGVGNNSVGSAGSAYGGGGSGGKANTSSDRNGGSGANGLVLVSWTLPPSLISSSSGIDFGFIPAGTVSSAISYSISSPYLIGAPGNISVTAPSGFEISLSSSSGFGSSLNIPFTGSILESTTIYVRFAPTISNTVYNGSISHSGGGASLELAVTGSTIPAYCTPTYSIGTNDGDYISLVQLGSINNATGRLAAPYYFYYSDLSTDLTAGASYTITLSAGTYPSANNITVWIDYNQDGVFEESEKLGNVTLGAAPATGTINFTIPAGAVSGTTRMRVREVWNTSNQDPCTGYSYGEAEDYNVNILTCDLSVSAIATETCLGSPSGTGTITAEGIDGTPPYTYSLNGGAYQSSNIFTGLAAGSYVVTVKDFNNCEASTTVSVSDPSISGDDQTIAGTDAWKGHLYDGTNFNSYMGHFDEAELFDQNFGGNQNCFEVISGATTRSVYTETFSVRYRMNSTGKGLYIADFGSDDGSRLFVDGQEVYDDWSDHSFRSRPRVLFSLSGSSNLAYEFYENGGANRVVFQNLTQLIENSLTVNTEQTLCTGETGAAISGDAFGALPSGITPEETGYQWTYSTSPDGARTAITDATAANYAPNTTVAPFNVPGTYYVYRNASLRSTNNVSPNPYIAVNESNAAVITVGVPPEITVQPEDQTVCQGDPAVFEVTASGAGLSYQWYTGNGSSWWPLNEGGNYAGTNTASLTISNTDTWMSGQQFRVVVSRSAGCQTTSDAATLTVNASPSIWNQPQSQTLCENGNTFFDVNSSGTAFQWQVNAGGAGWTDVTDEPPYSGSNTRTLQLTNTPALLSGNIYRVIVSTGSCSVVSEEVSLTVNSLPVIVDHPQPAVSCVNGDAIFEVTASGEELTYQWQTFGGSWYDISDGGMYAGTSTNQLTVMNTQMWQDGYRFRVLVGSASVCTAVSDEAGLTVTSQPDISIIYPGTPYCNGITNPQPVVINGPMGGIFSAIPAGLALDAVTGDITPSASAPGSYTVTYFYAGCGGLTATTTVEITEGLPAAVSITADPNPFCQGAAVTFTATPSNGGQNPVYQWKHNGINAGQNNPVWILENPQAGDVVYCEMISDDPCSGGNVVTSNTLVLSAAAALSNNSLNIEYGNHGSVCATANENSSANMSAPAGTVIVHIEFASYGTPNGSCNNFTYGSCHANTSFSVAETYLLGNNSAVIPATNGVFVDPCVGTYKRLYIQAIYGEPICTGSTPGQISGSMPAGGDGNYTYLWESSTTGPLTGFAPAPGINDQQHYTPEPLSATTWFRRTVYSAGCSDISRVMLIPVSGQNTWTGDTDTDWNNPGNWSCYIPNLTTDVTLSSGLSNYPVLSAGSPGMVRNLTIESGASLTVSGNTMQIAGAISNNGTFDATAGSIDMKGSVLQVIPPSTFLINTIKDLIISNSQGVSLTGELNILGYVKAAEGDLNADGHLTLISSETQTALIDGSGNGEVTGEVHMQRYLSSAFGYKYVGSPFSDATVAGFGEETDLGASFAEFYRYDEDRESTGWVAYTDPAAPLSPMSGYAANTGSTPAPMLMSLTGRVNNGVLTPVALYNHDKTYTRGFNLVGNPYPSPINWDAAEGWVRSNIDDAVYFFDAGGADRYTGTYSTYINGISSDGSAGPVIASMQGFFVHVSDGAYPVEGQFGMDNRVRVNNLSAAYHKNTETGYRPLIRLSAAYEASEENIDHLAVYFVENATSGFDSGLDAIKLENTDPEVPNFYSITECGRRLSIGAWPLSQAHEIPLGIKTEKQGMLTFSLISEENLPQGKRVYLKDKANGTVQDLKLKSAYKTSLAAGEVNERFTLLLSDYDLSQETFGSGSADAVVRDGLIYAVVRLRDEQVVVKLHNMAGQQLTERTLYGEGEHRLGQAPAPGVYIISVFTGMGTISKKILVQ
ncbi:MAG: GEVED domain-containing protein [Lentimicrobium sp.]|nr:GEVED domain-containing protein [Lentimicrobium sp.]